MGDLKSFDRVAHLTPAIKRPAGVEDGQHQGDEDRRNHRRLQRRGSVTVAQEASHRVRTLWLADRLWVSPPKPV